MTRPQIAKLLAALRRTQSGRPTALSPRILLPVRDILDLLDGVEKGLGSFLGEHARKCRGMHLLNLLITTLESRPVHSTGVGGLIWTTTSTSRGRSTKTTCARYLASAALDAMSDLVAFAIG